MQGRPPCHLKLHILDKLSNFYQYYFSHDSCSRCREWAVQIWAKEQRIPILSALGKNCIWKMHLENSFSGIWFSCLGFCIRQKSRASRIYKGWFYAIVGAGKAVFKKSLFFTCDAGAQSMPGKLSEKDRWLAVMEGGWTETSICSYCLWPWWCGTELLSWAESMIQGQAEQL